MCENKAYIEDVQGQQPLKLNPLEISIKKMLVESGNFIRKKL